MNQNIIYHVLFIIKRHNIIYHLLLFIILIAIYYFV